VFFNQVRIRNYKVIKDMQLQFSPGINLLIGDNGVGKTSVLDALSVALGGFLSGVSGVSVSGIQQTDVRFETKRIAGASSVIEYMTPTEVSCEMDIEGKLFCWSRTRESESSKKRTKSTVHEVASYAEKQSNDTTKLLPLISYMSIMRVSRSKRGDYGASSKKLQDRRCGYIGCLDSALDIKGIKEWCLKMEMEAFHQETPIPEYELFKTAVAEIMRNMNGLDGTPAISYSRVFEDIAYTENENTLPVAYLSAGYQSLLWMTMDFAYRLALLNPGQSDYHQATGVVLIDELDMHLHPKWQWNVLSALETVFPKIQFIIATHSPIIISSCKNGQLISLDAEQNVSYSGAAYAYSITDVLELKQGSLGVPKELRELSRKFDDAFNLGQYEQAQKILQEMKDKYGDDNTEVKSAALELELGEPDDAE
jgi:predicted ATP-binding protein involved in virulence